jgi:cysteine sulfinate desulfinase/cysteine desulfurase-like protein
VSVQGSRLWVYSPSGHGLSGPDGIAALLKKKEKKKKVESH